jgi:hypothetical protein
MAKKIKSVDEEQFKIRLDYIYELDVLIFYSGRSTSCFIYSEGRLVGSGAVIVSPNDTYSREEGRRLAYNKTILQLYKNGINSMGISRSNSFIHLLTKELYSEARLAYRKAFGLPTGTKE